MKGLDVRSVVTDSVTSEHRFVRWWRKENDFVDYDLLDRFLENLSPNEEIGGIELLTMDQMLNEVKRITGNRLTVTHRESGDALKWVHEGKTGEQTKECILTPEMLLNIYDTETRGNPIC
ncbi:hypothetical protein OR1_03397 [Geobacter sp. OR-1]|uniref:hypothetical protein n=1 Tax=Geobacter sp. OR-1 TaxID=1266765 RepID=UPI00054200B4|nr:hypothetical protein [Geobacter sp. OR-1]GAM11088.1 hypothetical protein OR1_03397 [Geobacter sp. OR-1]